MSYNNREYTVRSLESLDGSSKPGVQVVYKVYGPVNGNIKGENITVILMGDGDINGNVEVNNGEVVLIKGNINGDVKAETLLYPGKEPDKKQKSPEPAVKHYESNMCKICKHYRPTDDSSHPVYCNFYKRFFMSYSGSNCKRYEERS